MRGPTSRAGLRPAWVSGAMKKMTDATVSPMKTGCRGSLGRPTLHPSVSMKMKRTSRKVPKHSAAIASGSVTTATELPGLG